VEECAELSALIHRYHAVETNNEYLSLYVLRAERYPHEPFKFTPQIINCHDIFRVLKS
jgi:hypothetical protein